MQVRRRTLIAGSIAAAATRAHAADAPPAAPASTPFDAQTVRNRARELAATPFKAPDAKLPDPLAKLSYDQYRQIRFEPAQSLWHGMNLPFEAQFFHRGWLFPARVDMYEVAAGQAQPIAYRPEMFNFGPDVHPVPGDLGFAGFRLHAPINRPDYYDEVCVFLGASYFRAVAKDQGYGMSSRGLSLKTGDPAGEEFPLFRAFWLERPQPGTNSVVVSALLDSESCTGAMRFTIRPGEATIFDVECSLFPRVDIAEAGIATGTSMFYFDASDRTGIDDYRRAVHDSDGLMMQTGRGEDLWRQLANPQKLQISAFLDSSPRGFGLVQRKRKLSEFEDLEARYERRPSLWAEPIGDWNDGIVELIEIPTKDETHDNIVAFWRPKQVLRAKSQIDFTYRLHWLGLPPQRRELARFLATRCGAATDQGARLFVLDVAGDSLKALPADAHPKPMVATDKGEVRNIVAEPNPAIDGWRISFELVPKDTDIAELRAQLLSGDKPLTETWVYRWTA